MAAVDSKFSAQPKNTKSMTITIQDLQPQKAFCLVPDCQVPYLFANNLMVGTLGQISDLIRAI